MNFADQFRHCVSIGIERGWLSFTPATGHKAPMTQEERQEKRRADQKRRRWNNSRK